MTKELKEKLKGKKRMGKTRGGDPKIPHMRQPDQPLAVFDRSPKSQARAGERFRGISERNERQAAARARMEEKHAAGRIKFPKIKR